MRLFDTHAHLLDDRFDEDRDAMLRSVRGRGVELVLECATDRDYVPKAVALARQYDFIYCKMYIVKSIYKHTP